MAVALSATVTSCVFAPLAFASHYGYGSAPATLFASTRVCGSVLA